jgi:hypothetical protein
MNTAEVGVGSAKATGAIWVAPQGTALPTDATTALGAAFKLLGFTSDAGVQISESTSTDAIRAWEGRTEVYNVQTEYTESVAFTPIQCNSDVAELTWGADWVEVDTQTGSIHAKHHAGTLEPVVIAIETTPRTNIIKRYTGTFQLTERGEATLDGTTVEGRALTFNAIADAEGVTMHEFTAFTN